MAESKNTFIKSKMNQDLDERLIPNGEYREAYNISVSQSEGADVGTLQNVLGNVLVTDFGLTDDCNVKIIGTYVDDQNKEIYVFLTNFVDTSVDTVSNYPPDDVICQIWKRNVETNENTKLVEGKFLNFSLTHHIIGINLIEDLLFWTDNRNQPRKINVNKANPNSSANPTYYTNDDQINVAKYYPFEPISLIKNYIVDFEITDDGNPSDYNDHEGEVVSCSGGSGEGLTVRITDTGPVNGELRAIEIVNQGNGYANGDVVNVFPRIGTAQLTLTVESATTMKDTCSEYLPIYSIFPPYLVVSSTITKNVAWEIGSPTTGLNITDINYVGALVKINSLTTDSPYLARVVAQNPGATPKTITLDWPNSPNAISNVTSIEVGINPDYQEDWPGDCEYLKDKFVRFAYRFKFDDNEYSLISPFTQACFIPKQDGYFLEDTKQLSSSTVDVLDSEQAYENTDNLVMQNKVTNVELLIPCPEYLGEVDSTFDNLESQLHVNAIEIIYKDDADQNLRVLDTLRLQDFNNLNSNVLSYDYQSRSPKRALPANEITRASDRVPIRALAQEVAGNRVIYGNYVDGYTSLDLLNYEVGAAEKQSLATDSTVKKEYQNHTLKQNRNYQVGIILTDRYGRNSDVILSSIDVDSSLQSAVTYSGSTIFHPFYSQGFSSNELISGTNTTWPGDVLRVKFNSQIPETIGKPGYPGLFIGYVAPEISNLYPGTGYNQADGTNEITSGGSGTGLTVDFTTFKATASYITSVTINSPGSGYEPGDVITITRSGVGGDATFIYNPGQNPNLTGWYSYKIVVKQTEQDYYNVYLPGIINGAINKEGVENPIEATLSLYGDNINKVPKDLTNVGPSSTNYNSAEKLVVRVVNTNDFSSTQYYPDTSTVKVTQISEMSDLGISLARFQDAVSAPVVTPGTTFDLTNFLEGNIFPGMSITSVNSAGSSKLTSADGVYVKAYFPSGGGSTVIVNKTLTAADIAVGDLFTFGPPGVIFNSNNNPLIGILSTSEKIGIPEEDDFKTQLAVAETEPTESLLDIYYETTSSGLVNQLNNLIAEGIPATAPARISPIAITFDESDTGTAVISNTFNLLDNANADILEPTVTGNLISVFDKTFPTPNDRTSEFTLNDNGTGGFTIATNKAVGEGFYVGSNNQQDTFSYTVELTYDGISILKSIDGELGNIRPVYQGAYDGTTYNISKVTPENIPSANTAFECFNGSGDTSLQQNEIEWTLLSAIATRGVNNPKPTNFAGNQVAWPVGYVAPPNPSTYQAEDYQIVEGRDYSDLFNLQSLSNLAVASANVLNAYDLQFRFQGINAINGGNTNFSYTYQAVVGYEPSPFTSWIGGGTAIYETANGVVTTSALIREVDFTLTFEAKDAAGSANSLSAGLLVITVTAGPN